MLLRSGLMSDKLPVLATPAAKQPKAAREQIDVQPFEFGLLDLARVHHATVAWWHGYRQAEERFGSWCYVCESFTVTWDRKWPIPLRAKQLIDTHKYDHRAGRIPATVAPSRKDTTQ